MSILKKLGIALLVILLLAVAAGYFLTRGDTADVAFDETVGTDPTLDEPEEESIPTVAIAEPVGWAEGELPLAAEGLVVNRFADGLDHPRTLQALPNGDILVTLTRAPKLDTGEVSTTLTRANGQTLMLLMMCGRTAAANASASREDVTNALRQERLTGYAEQLLEQLRADARIVRK